MPMAKIKLLDFWAVWCGPCKIMNPILDELEKQFPDVEFVKIDVDKEVEFSGRYGVMSIPTFVVEKDGVEVGRKIGVVPKQELVKLLQS
jgi:thioredoxin 1